MASHRKRAQVSPVEYVRSLMDECWQHIPTGPLTPRKFRHDFAAIGQFHTRKLARTSHEEWIRVFQVFVQLSGYRVLKSSRAAGFWVASIEGKLQNGTPLRGHALAATAKVAKPLSGQLQRRIASPRSHYVVVLDGALKNAFKNQRGSVILVRISDLRCLLVGLTIGMYIDEYFESLIALPEMKEAFFRSATKHTQMSRSELIGLSGKFGALVGKAPPAPGLLY